LVEREEMPMDKRKSLLPRNAERTSPTRSEPALPKTGTPTRERLVDEMIEETLPASDATQLPGRADCDPGDSDAVMHRDDAGTLRTQGEPPRTIGNQGVIPASRNLRNTVDLGDAAGVDLRLERDLKGLHVELTTNGTVLDAAGVDRLIAALSAKRSQMIE
jgi:hypothetical protein